MIKTFSHDQKEKNIPWLSHWTLCFKLISKPMILANCRHKWLVTSTSLVILKLMSEFMCFTLTNLNIWIPLERNKRLIGGFVLILHNVYSITYTQDLCAVHPYIVGDEISMPPWWASPFFLCCFLFLSSVVADSSWMIQSHFSTKHPSPKSLFFWH